MEKKLRLFSAVLLFIVGSSAIGGGWMLIRDPSGASMQFTSDLLNQTPFDSYLVPGIILLVALGFLSILAGIFSIRKTMNYNLWVALMGCILFIWLTTELIFNIDFYHRLYHIPLYTISILLIAIGVIQRKIA